MYFGNLKRINMTIENISCSELQISSELIDPWAMNYPLGGVLTLTYTFLCGTPTTIILDQTNVPAPAPYTFKFTSEQGVYFFELKLVDPSGDITTESMCYFNECGLGCELAKELSAGCTDIHRYYTFLKAINNCNQCDCKYACIAYNNIITKENNCTCY